MLEKISFRNRQVGASAFVANKLSEQLKEYMVSSDALDNSEPVVFRVKDGIVENLTANNKVLLDSMLEDEFKLLYGNPYKDLPPLDLIPIKNGNRKDKRFTPKKKKRKK